MEHTFGKGRWSIQHKYRVAAAEGHKKRLTKRKESR